MEKNFGNQEKLAENQWDVKSLIEVLIEKIKGDLPILGFNVELLELYEKIGQAKKEEFIKGLRLFTSAAKRFLSLEKKYESIKNTPSTHVDFDPTHLDKIHNILTVLEKRISKQNDKYSTLQEEVDKKMGWDRGIIDVEVTLLPEPAVEVILQEPIVSNLEELCRYHTEDTIKVPWDNVGDETPPVLFNDSVEDKYTERLIEGYSQDFEKRYINPTELTSWLTDIGLVEPPWSTRIKGVFFPCEKSTGFRFLDIEGNPIDPLFFKGRER